jgi:hypothetical protein
LPIAKTPKQSFAGDNHFLSVAVGTAAIADGRGQPWSCINFSKAVIAVAGLISSFSRPQNSKAVIRGTRSVFCQWLSAVQRQESFVTDSFRTIQQASFWTWDSKRNYQRFPLISHGKRKQISASPSACSE